MSPVTWASAVQTTKHQLYISRCTNPFVNLSIEHFLLTKSPRYSALCFVYVNRPSVVIGRNQNPWLEVNFASLAARRNEIVTERSVDNILFVRRRSGGGTVYHDEGNVNYCVICPPSEFTRDKHAEMAAQALRSFNPRARVNERHDIVLDQGTADSRRRDSLPKDLYHSAFRTDDPAQPPLKVSGSAFKTIRDRALHHGTCLLNCERLDSISNSLRSPARGFISAKGVESVRSPVGNAIDHSDKLQRDKVRQAFPASLLLKFQELYQANRDSLDLFVNDPERWTSNKASTVRYSPKEDDWVSGYLDQDLTAIPEIQKGVQELKSNKWRFGQTPRFTLSSHPGYSEVKPQLTVDFPQEARVHLQAQHGNIVESNITLTHDQAAGTEERTLFSSLLNGHSIHEIADFEDLLTQKSGQPERADAAAVGRWLNLMFGKAHVSSTA